MREFNICFSYPLLHLSSIFSHLVYRSPLNLLLALFLNITPCKYKMVSTYFNLWLRPLFRNCNFRGWSTQNRAPPEHSVSASGLHHIQTTHPRPELTRSMFKKSVYFEWAQRLYYCFRDVKPACPHGFTLNFYLPWSALYSSAWSQNVHVHWIRKSYGKYGRKWIGTRPH